MRSFSSSMALRVYEMTMISSGETCFFSTRCFTLAAIVVVFLRLHQLLHHRLLPLCVVHHQVLCSSQYQIAWCRNNPCFAPQYDLHIVNYGFPHPVSKIHIDANRYLPSLNQPQNGERFPCNKSMWPSLLTALPIYQTKTECLPTHAQ